MANTKSIQKVLDYLKTKEEAVSPSEICFGVMLRYRTVKEVLEFLKMNNQVLILSTGKHTLVQLKSEEIPEIIEQNGRKYRLVEE